MVGKIIFLLVIPIITVFILVSLPTTPWNEEDIEYTDTPTYTPEPDYSDVPEPYYVLVPQRYGVDALQEYLQGGYWTDDFEEGVFDCTEMSAYLERILENEGFHTYIAVGQLDNDRHCWVEVETAPQKYTIVEATTLRVITPIDLEYYEYHREDQIKSIYIALRVSQSEFDWWNE